MTSKQNQWIVGINAVASAIEHDADNVREVLLEAGGKNPRIGDIEDNARRRGIDVRRVAQQALDGVAGGLRTKARWRATPRRKTFDEDALPGLVEGGRRPCAVLVLDGVQDPHTSAPACAAPPRRA